MVGKPVTAGVTLHRIRMTAFWIAVAILCRSGTCAETWRAFSLASFVRLRIACAAKGPCGEELLSCGGITTLMGYVADRPGGDVVLVGRAEGGREAIRIDDFVVALRNAYYAYAEKKDNTIMYAAPTCSIDPDPAVLTRLADIGEQILGSNPSEERIRTMLETWRTICREPQTVQVLGVPRNTNFARIMLEADYELKKLVDGSERADVPGFASLTEMILSQCENDYRAGKRISVTPSMLNRFWFSPGLVRVRDDGGSALIDTCGVRLLTEEELLSGQGRLKQTGKSGEAAEKFARKFEEVYNEIAAKRPAYRRLEGLYRLVLMARVMHLKDAFGDAHFDLSYLLERFPLLEVEVGATVPGWPHYDEREVRVKVEGGYRIGQFRIPSCGGVSMDIRPERGTALGRDREGKVERVAKAALAARPSPEGLVWDFEAGLTRGAHER